MTGDCSLHFKFLRRSVSEKQLMSFQSEISVFKYLRRSVDEAWAREILVMDYTRNCMIDSVIDMPV